MFDLENEYKRNIYQYEQWRQWTDKLFQLFFFVKLKPKDISYFRKIIF